MARHTMIESQPQGQREHNPALRHTGRTGSHADDVKSKLSWKLPITYAIAAVVIALFALRAHGHTTVRLGSSDQHYSIPDFSLSAPATLWVFFILAVCGSAWAVVSTLSRGKYGSRGRALDMVAMVGMTVITVLAFLVFAGAGSDGSVTFTSVLVTTVALSTPLIFGSLSGVLSEHSGVVNIAIEGDLLIGAFVGVLTTSVFHMSWVGLVFAPLAGAFVGALLALFSVKYGVDQIIVGVVLNVLVLGLTTFFYDAIMSGEGQQRFNTNQYALHPIRIPILADIPVIGPALFNQTILVYLMYVIAVFLTVFLYHSRWGLRLRAVGEHPEAADTVGIKVNRTRSANAILGSALAGLGGAYFTIGAQLAFTNNMSAGNGYIALAAMILGKWNPVGAVGASVMFGFATAVAQMIPSLNGSIPSQVVSMIPYVVTIIAVAGFVGKSRPPAAENIPYLK